MFIKMENIFQSLSLLCICTLSSISNSSPLPPNITFPSNLIYFGELNSNQNVTSAEISTTPPTKSLVCRPEQTEYKGKCLQVLQGFPCPEGEWLVEDPNTGRGLCVLNKCAGTDNTGYYKSQCVPLRSEEYCPKGMRIFIYKSSRVDCDCKEGHIYNGVDGFCYEAYRQGPCKAGAVFATTTTKLSNGTENRRTGCKSNSCKTDGFYCNGPEAKCQHGKSSSWVFPSYEGIFKFSSSKSRKELTKNCVKFGEPCTPEGKGIFHPDTNQPYCQKDAFDGSLPSPNTRIIGNVPIFKCAPGSRRDILGNCRTPTVIDFS